MFNIGMGEIAVIAILGLLVFGPDRLPKAIQTLAAGIRSLRSSAADATKSLQDAAGLDNEATKQTMNDLAELHPKRIMGSVVDDVTGDKGTNGSSANGASSKTSAGKLGDFDPEAP